MKMRLNEGENAMRNHNKHVCLFVFFMLLFCRHFCFLNFAQMHQRACRLSLLFTGGQVFLLDLFVVAFF